MNKTLTIASVLTGILSTTTTAVYGEDGDNSETETDQKVNIDPNGSGETNIDACGNNLIDSGNGELPLNIGACNTP